MNEESLSLDVETIVDAAYAWRYALVTPGSDLEQAETALAEAVDTWDVNRPHDDNGGPLKGNK